MGLRPTEPRRMLLWPDFVEVLAERAPEPDRLYMVGGMVRDALLGRPIHDVDLATPGDGLKAARRLADAFGAAYYPVDPQRRTGRVILPGTGEATVIDVASFRGETLLEDLEGRDFTVNAMAVRLDAPQALYDPLGGQQDLFDHKLIRQCLPGSIASDPIRALRAVRQSLQFKLRLEAGTRTAAREAAPALLADSGGLAQPERVRDEFFRMLTGPQPAVALRALHRIGLLAPLCPFPLGDALEESFALIAQLTRLYELISPARTDNTASQLMLGVAVMILDRYRRQLQEHLQHEHVEGRPASALALLGALTPPEVSEPGAAWAERLKLANAEARFVERLVASRQIVPTEPPVDSRRAHRYYREVGEPGVTGVLLMLAGHLRAGTAPEDWGTVLEHVAAPLFEAFFWRHQEVVAPPPLVDGNDLINRLEMRPGPRLGQILRELLEEQAAGTVRTREEALRLAQRLDESGS